MEEPQIKQRTYRTLNFLLLCHANLDCEMMPKLTHDKHCFNKSNTMQSTALRFINHTAFYLTLSHVQNSYLPLQDNFLYLPPKIYKHARVIAETFLSCKIKVHLNLGCNNFTVVLMNLNLRIREYNLYQLKTVLLFITIYNNVAFLNYMFLSKTMSG